jgi:hypothetical protein
VAVEGSLPRSQEPVIPRPCITFRNRLSFYAWELLAPRPTPNLEDHPLSAVRDCLFNVFVATLYVWRPSLLSAIRGRSMPWWQGPTYRYSELINNSLHACMDAPVSFHFEWLIGRNWKGCCDINLTLLAFTLRASRNHKTRVKLAEPWIWSRHLPNICVAR